METNPTIITISENLRLRPWTLADAPALARIANDRAIWRNMRDRFPHPYAEENAAFFIENVANGPSQFVRAIEVDGEVAGSVGLMFQADISRRSAEVGYWLGREYWGRGLATTALTTLNDYAFTNFDLVRLFAIVFAWNPASARVLEKAGYTLEARMRQAVTKDGETIDALLYARVRGE